MKKTVFLLVCLLGLLPSAAFAQCTGLAPANQYCGNPTSQQAFPQWAPVSGGSGSLVIGTSPITGGTNNNLLAVISGKLGQLTALPNGTTATTQATSDASLSVATDQFVQNALVGAGLVTSVFGRAGAVTAQTGDYTAAQVTNALSALNNLSDLQSISTARTNLGLGTAALANTGTSGATLPFLNGVNTWSATQTFGAITTNGTTNVITGPFQIGGNTMKFPVTPATLAFQSGTFTPGDCIQVASSGAGGAVGALADAGAACGSGGGGGGSTSQSQIFKAGINYTPGITTSLTLSSLPVTGTAVWVFEDGVSQPSDGTNTAPSQWSINLTTGIITFTQPIQAITDVYVSWLQASISGGTVSSVSVASANGFGGSVANPTTTPAITLTTSITGVIAGSGGALTAASVTGTGSVVQSVSPTISSPTFGGTVAGANTIPLSILAQSTANTVLGNWTSGTANVTVNSMPSCSDSSGNHLNYVSGTGITCGTSTNGITALTGDVTASGTGSVAATIAANAVTYAKFVQPTAHSIVANPTGSTANAQNVTLGSTLNFSGTALNCTTATTSQIGCVEPDGTSISISAGVISVIGTPATSISASGGTTVTGGTNGNCLVITAGNVGNTSCGTATSIAVGVTTVSSGTSGAFLYDNAGTLGNLAVIPYSAGGTQVKSAASFLYTPVYNWM
jgi:hypothetical protein